MKYFTDAIFEKTSNGINKYSLEVGGIFISTSSLKIRKFIGASMIMGRLKLPCIRIYWSPSTRIPVIVDSNFFKLLFQIT